MPYVADRWMFDDRSASTAGRSVGVACLMMPARCMYDAGRASDARRCGGAACATVAPTEKRRRMGGGRASAGSETILVEDTPMPENADTPTTSKPPTFRTPDRKLGPWADLPVGWTQEEQPKGSNIWRRYRPLPKAKKARAAEQKRRRDHRYTAQNERTNYTLRPVVQSALDTVRAHLLVSDGGVCSEQRLVGRLAVTAASDLRIYGKLDLLDLPEDQANPGRPGKKLIGVARASEVPDDDSDLHDESIIRFVGPRAEEIAVLAEEEGLPFASSAACAAISASSR